MNNIWVRYILSFIVFVCVAYVVSVAFIGALNMQLLVQSLVAGVIFVVLMAIYLANKAKQK